MHVSELSPSPARDAVSRPIYALVAYVLSWYRQRGSINRNDSRLSTYVRRSLISGQIIDRVNSITSMLAELADQCKAS